MDTGFYTFVTEVSSIASVMRHGEAIAQARELDKCGLRVRVVKKDGVVWLEGEALETALLGDKEP